VWLGVPPKRSFVRVEMCPSDHPGEHRGAGEFLMQDERLLTHHLRLARLRPPSIVQQSIEKL
jgi:hypothetical protein